MELPSNIGKVQAIAVKINWFRAVLWDNTGVSTCSPAQAARHLNRKYEPLPEDLKMTESGPAYNAMITEKAEVKPAAGVAEQPQLATMAERVEFFNENGFLILRGLLSKTEVQELLDECDNMAENHATMPRVREGFSLEPNQDAKQKRPTFRKIGGFTDFSEPYQRLVFRHPVVLDHLHAILGSRIELWRDVLMMKPARVGREKPWHQDSSYWPWQPMNLVSVLTALDAAGAENGGLQVIPGSHKAEVQHYGQELRVDLDEEFQAKTRYVELEAGDCLLFHSLLLHGSEANHSDRDRRVCIISYKPGGLKFIGKGEPRECPLVSQR